ncbi:DUF397 domain-containing protein [Nocardiopsis sp. EMB25]|nr:DUF397 domain-containing protein [Nocardiopsis sp. EMB25]
MNGDRCVEARVATAGADIRDTRNRDTGHLSFPASEWPSLVRGAQKRGSSV